ncbi:3-dehydroquinate synthase [Flavobacterium sp. Fl-77]|uniref:3-dehydroquinate synthase n=1 Tax=Flavobacterium flavipigmentatum TaxID=2893884 RepID=A0AAJ2VYQ6_9FLAO|nr:MULTISPECIES: 3-dehydroquinate synthase [unclassified Flavobacterium]MDX6183406.1 3-dehydroquinate synthase [Flavobacterium sp. Fl-33]MDX6186690.1 3-dehydroquinate synthase [Flavobacterium sp. Fl-77]UFH38542.1 3-dehydroquinate synthase [Flavobacterium sp. F-70]
MKHQHILQQNFQVAFNYDIIFNRSLFDVNNSSLIDVIKKEPSFQQPKVTIVIDKGVVDCTEHFITKVIHYFNHQQFRITENNILVVEGGEAVKNNHNDIESVLELINNNKIDRHSFLIAIGGGAVLDAVGYAAAIAHRGVRLIRIPTTILSQNDSGVGVKNSMNYFGKKNFLGTFAPPYAVLNDSDFLKTLSKRHWRSGISEAIKVALIKEASFFDWIEKNTQALNNRDILTMETLIIRCAALHTDHISKKGDPFEKGSSRPLDFGHWAAHKMEQLTNYEITHGEAVAIGIALDVTYSFLSKKIDQSSLDRILRCFLTLGFAITHPILDTHLDEVIKGLDEFREHLGGQLTIMLLSDIGTGEEVHSLDNKLIAASIQYLYSFCQLNTKVC